MRRTSRLIIAIVFACACHAIVLSQNVSNDGWSRVQSDDGEFSIEIPADYSYFMDADGFVVGNSTEDFPVRDMKLLTAYSEGTLVSFEIYRAHSAAQKELMEATEERGVRTRKIKVRDIEMKELTRIEDAKLNPVQAYYFVSRYFRSKDFVYILSCLSRSGETPVMTRFFDSLKFSPGSVHAASGIRRMGDLKLSAVDVKTVDNPPVNSNSAALVAPSADNYKSLAIVSKPRAWYIKGARDREVAGAVRLRMVFTKNGFIPKIDILRSLPEGLVRQAIFAALRIKFLPAERDGNPISVIKTLEYTFSIY